MMTQVVLHAALEDACDDCGSSPVMNGADDDDEGEEDDEPPVLIMHHGLCIVWTMVHDFVMTL